MHADKFKILVVDDDLRLRDLLNRYLTDQGFSVQAVANSAEMTQLMSHDNFDLMVLDLMLPGEDGLSICRRLRSTGCDMAIIMLTAKGDEVDRIIGLEMGADDYLPKPFNPRELVARIQAVLRRRPPATRPGAPGESGIIKTFGACALDLATRILTKDGNPVQITSGEFAVLKALLNNPHQPLSRDRLMALARGREHEAFDRSIDVQISRLRRLVEHDPAKPRYIQTVWGVGYVFVPDGESQ